MKAAQNMALELPSHQPEPGFRANLERRIASGEGSHEAIFREPIPGPTKVRYVLSGAAAALVLIAGIHMISGDDRAPTQRPDAGEVAQSNTERTAPASNVMLASTQQRVPQIGVQPVTEWDLAKNFADRCAKSVVELRLQMRSGPMEENWTELERTADDLRISIGVMSLLDNKGIIALPGTVKSEFREAELYFRQAKQGPSWDQRRLAIKRLGQMNLERVSENLPILCCRSAQDLGCDLQDVVQRIPESRRMFGVIVFSETGPLTLQLGEPR